MCIRLRKTFECAYQVLVFEDPHHDHVGLSTLDVHFFVHLRSFHLEMQILTINATMIRLNIASPTTSVCGNADSDSLIPSSPAPKKLSADHGERQL
jgi:hypothetical protein